jgi:hypothetical protein
MPPTRQPPIPFPDSGLTAAAPRAGWRRAAVQGFPFPQGRTVTSSDRVNVNALRDITDDSGGRTEIVRTGRDLDPATAGIADELSRQYYLGYASTQEKDGRWHTIRVELKDSSLRMRARRGYIATP